MAESDCDKFNSEHRRQFGFDIVKAIACIAVVLIHYNFSGKLGVYVKELCRFAVPAFFMISGYFFRDPAHQIRKLFVLLFWATVFYGLLFYYEPRLLGVGPVLPWGAYSEKFLSGSCLIKFFVTNNGLFAAPLWFIGALIYCNLTMLVLFHTSTRMKAAYRFIVPLLVVMAITLEFSRVLGVKWAWITIPGFKTGGGLGVGFFFAFRALPFFLIGCWLKSKKEKIRLWPIPAFAIMIVAFAVNVVSLFEYEILGGRDTQFYIASVVSSILFIIWAIKFDVCICGSGVGWFGKELSMPIYVFHTAVGWTIVQLAGKYHWWGSKWFNPTKALIVITGSIIVSILFRLLQWVLVTKLPQLAKCIYRPYKITEEAL